MVVAEPGEAIGKRHDDGWHALFADQPVELFRQVLSETDPLRLRQAAAREPDKIPSAGHDGKGLPLLVGSPSMLL